MPSPRPAPDPLAAADPAADPDPAAAGRPWDELLAEGRSNERLVRLAREAPRTADLAQPPPDLHPELLSALHHRGIEQLYEHQLAALEQAFKRTTIVTTGTASGKSLCFQLPTLDILLRDPRARAIYVYPTKALAQDQARSLAEFALTKSIRPAIYDGDTPREARAQIRRRSNLVLTNPDMLHVGILPNHPAWADLFANLALLVIDEAHVYSGVFGSHVANLIRRLRRIAAAYGTRPRILLASATIANPRQLARRLTGLDDVALVDEDSSPAPGRELAMWNPPLIDRALGTRAPALGEAALVLSRLLRKGLRIICFVKSRKGVELLSKLLADDLRSSAPELADLVAPYRAGYTPQQRRELERRLTAGELRAVITTDALELGIDIGRLDAAVVVTFPGTVSSLRQMWGRAGRRRAGLAMYIAGDDALDQFFCRNPLQFLERPVEAAILDHESPVIHRAHLLCAAHEGPLGADDAEFLGPDWESHAEILVSAGRLRPRGTGGAGGASDRYVPRDPGSYPAAAISLRSASPDIFTIIDISSGEVLGTTEAARAHSTIHEGAVYLHQSRSYEVRELDLEHTRALVAPFEGDWYTQPKIETLTVIEKLHETRTALGLTLSFGEISVSETALAYERRRLPDHARIDFRTLDLPETSFSTQALWYVLDPATLERDLDQQSLLGALHAIEHAQIAVLPLIAMCDRWDIGGLSTNLHPQTGLPSIFIYDGHPGGIGITRTAFERFTELSRDAHTLIAQCPCRDGCPSCVQSPKCGNLNEPLHKAGAAAVLARMLGAV